MIWIVEPKPREILFFAFFEQAPFQIEFRPFFYGTPDLSGVLRFRESTESSEALPAVERPSITLETLRAAVLLLVLYNPIKQFFHAMVIGVPEASQHTSCVPD